MASFQNFRSAFNGFNREDVVHYIEFINNKHASEVNQLNNEMSALYQDLEAYRSSYEEAAQAAQLLQQEQGKSAAQEQQILALQQEIEELKAQMEQNKNMPRTGSELEDPEEVEATMYVYKVNGRWISNKTVENITEVIGYALG